MDLVAYNKSTFKGTLRESVKQVESIRRHTEQPIDISFADFIKEKHQVSFDSFLLDLGINPSVDTIRNIFTTPDDDIRWVVPEIIREALLLGYRAAPIWPNIIAAEEQTTGLSQIMPHLNMSDATPARVGEAETIPVGYISYGQKRFSIYKIGKGIKIPYEVTQYSTLNVVKIFLRDFGIKLGHAQDTLAIDCLINGEQVDGSESAPVIGIGDTNVGKVYRDFLKVWIRMSRMGRLPNTILGGETAALETLDLAEFKTRQSSGPTVATINLKTPIPTSMNYFIHGNIPANQEVIMDPSSTLIKFNAQPLLVESEKIVSNQTEAFYATLTSGFAKLFRDAAIVMDASLAFGSYGFPTYMDVDPFQNITIE